MGIYCQRVLAGEPNERLFGMGTFHGHIGEHPEISYLLNKFTYFRQ